jgi:hypothetical protein
MKRHDHTPSGSSDKLSPAERREMRLLKPNKLAVQLNDWLTVLLVWHDTASTSRANCV